MADRLRSSLVGFALLGWSCLAPPTFGQAGAPATTPPPSDDDRIGIAQGATTDLTLEELVARVLENNLQLVVLRVQREQASDASMAARGVYDPGLTLGGTWSDVETPDPTTLQAAEGHLLDESVDGTVGLGGLVPAGGGAYDLSFDLSRQETNSLFTALEPQYTAGFSLSYTQPLWQGLAIDAERLGVEVAARDELVSDEALRLGLMEEISFAATTFWELVAARRAADVQRQGLDRIQSKIEAAERQLEQGLLAEIDLTSVRAQEAAFAETLAVAEEQVTVIENLLKGLVSSDRLDPIWSTALVPAEHEDLSAPSVPLSAAVDTALRQRPELAQLDLSREVAELNLRFLTNLVRPRVDLVGSYGLTSAAGTDAGRIGRPVDDRFLGDAGDAVDQVLSGDYPQLTVGVQLTFPVRNRTARANRDRAEGDIRVLEARRAQLTQQIESDVRNAIQGLESARAALDAASAARTADQAVYESELRKFRAGMSSSFLLLERHEDLVASEVREAIARSRFQQRIVAYFRATGTILTELGIATTNAGGPG